MTSPKRPLLAAVIGVLLGCFLLGTPAVATVVCPSSGTLTWTSPAYR
jgi:hypothetical protein